MKNSGFLTRALSAVVLVVLLLLAGLRGGYLLLAFVVFISLVGLYEFYKATGIYTRKAEDEKNNFLAYAGFLGSAIYFIIMAVGGILPVGISLNNVFSFDSMPDIFASFDNLQLLLRMGYTNLVFYFVIFMLVIFMAVYVFTFPRFNVEQVSFAFIGVIYVSVFMSFIYLVRGLDGGEYLFWLIFISSWICDTCAYLVGCSIGKHKLAPVLSPKKSIEGAVGGIAGSIIVAFVFGYFVEYKLLGGKNFAAQYIIICGVGAVVSQIGDLAASAVKRNKEIKDYGNLIPGHGGILDRFDSVIFVAPFIYVLSMFLF